MRQSRNQLEQVMQGGLVAQIHRLTCWTDPDCLPKFIEYATVTPEASFRTSCGQPLGMNISSPGPTLPSQKNDGPFIMSGSASPVVFKMVDLYVRA